MGIGCQWIQSHGDVRGTPHRDDQSVMLMMQQVGRRCHKSLRKKSLRKLQLIQNAPKPQKVRFLTCPFFLIVNCHKFDNEINILKLDYNHSEP